MSEELAAPMKFKVGDRYTVMNSPVMEITAIIETPESVVYESKLADMTPGPAGADK